MTRFELYQFEGSPFCETVRTFCSENGISLTMHTPRNGDTVVNQDHMDDLLELGGSDQVPFLVDNEHDVSLYESDDIVEYLEEHAA